MSTSTAEKLAVVILIDALGWEIVQRYDFCRDLVPRSGALETVFGYSSAAIPSLLSGRTPAEHGAWAMYRYSPRTSPFRWLRFLPPLPHALEWRARVLTRRLADRRRAIRGYYDLYEIPLRTLAYFDVAQRGDPYEPGDMNGETIFDRFVQEKVPYQLWTYRTPERENFEALERAVRSNHRMLFLYTAELDALMHRVGIFHDDVEAKLADYERFVRSVLECAGSAGRETTLYLFSDHGMTDVTQTVDLMSRVEGWGYRVGRDMMAFYDSTMARFWCAPQGRPKLVERLNATGWGRVVPEQELKEYGCDFDGGEYGDIIFLVSPGLLIVPSYMGKTRLGAMHGYDPEDRYSKGCFLTNDPSGELPRSILDLKEYLLERIVEKN